jgi:hypothetical protein
MSAAPPLLSFLLLMIAGWVHRHQLLVIEFLQAENRLLKERLRGKRIRFTDSERALLGRKAKAVGHKTLLGLETIVSPDTLLRWHRRFVAQKWDFSKSPRSGASRHHARAFRIDRAHGAGQSKLGLHPHSRRVSQSQTQGGSRHDCECVEAQWH